MINLNNLEANSDTSENETTGVVFTQNAYEKKRLKVVLDENEESVNIKKSPSESSDSLEVAYSENEYYYILEQNGWYKIVLDNNQYGWINEINVLELE